LAGGRLQLPEEVILFFRISPILDMRNFWRIPGRSEKLEMLVKFEVILPGRQVRLRG
jgi:hypothetical protein